MNRKAFTLIELLAVVVIIGIVLSIAIPSVSTLLENAKREALRSSANVALKAMIEEKMKDVNFDMTTVNATNIETYGLSDDNYLSVTFDFVLGEEYVVVIGKNKWQGLKACGTISAIEVVSTSDIVVCENI